ncbi:MAG: glyceraldehyde-3-phosphate dehydrogenase, partial [Methanothermobacter sp.]|nr:glyceraldehyde-3-phosphate dehydrogenase [Methanothermobacter sp.]
MISVAINGYGTIGKRVADAVAAQDDMKVVGVSKTKPDFEARVAIEKGYDLYISIPERENLFDEAGMPVSGTVEEMLEEADIVVDATPEGIGAKNLEMYREKGIKAIFQ